MPAGAGHFRAMAGRANLGIEHLDLNPLELAAWNTLLVISPTPFLLYDS
jgi:hypothetical protein